MNTAEKPVPPAAQPAARPPLDPHVVARLAASLPQTCEEQAWLAERFYGALLADHPGLRPMFTTDIAQQTAKLIASVRVVLASVGRPDALRESLGKLGRGHVALGARGEHYPIVCERLADALAELRGGDRELRAHWFDALQRVSALMLAAT